MEFRSYEELLKRPTIELIRYVNRYSHEIELDGSGNFTDISSLLPKLTNNNMVLTTLYQYAIALKRELSKSGKQSDYKDMIDKENIIKAALSAVDMQYKAASKLLSQQMEDVNFQHREYFQTKNIP